MELERIILSVLLGATIGYVTNYVAIRMLFKPYKTWKMWKISIPFTPGIIPKSKDQIATSIGRMVGDILLNEDTIRDKLNSSFFRERTLAITMDLYKKTFSKKVKSFSEYFPSHIVPVIVSIIDHVSNMLADITMNYIYSDKAKTFFRQLLDKEIEKIWDKPLTQFITVEKITQITNEKIAEIINSDGFDRKLQTIIMDMAKGIISSNATIRQIIPDNFVQSVQQLFVNLRQEINLHMVEFIKNEELKMRITKGVQEILYDYIKNLSFFESIVAGYVKAAKKIERDIPILINKTIGTIEQVIYSPESQNKINDTLVSFFNRTVDKEIRYFFKLDFNDSEGILTFVQRFSKLILNWLKNDNTIAYVQEEVNLNIERLANNSIGDLINSVYRVEKGVVVDKIIDVLYGFFSKQVTLSKLKDFYSDKLNYVIFEYPIGSLKGKQTLISANDAIKNMVIPLFVDLFYNYVNSNLSTILKEINFNRIVEDKINMFPVEEVENIVLLVVKRHLKWINIFGAALGAIIGGMQFIIYWIENA